MDNFKLLDCFDIEIKNLDITKNYIYVLRLIEDRYYIGRTSNILIRIEQHFKGEGSIYTKEYKPIKVIEINEEETKYDEETKTIEYMERYGWEKVRGAQWCSIVIKKPKFKNKKRKIKNKGIVFYIEDDEIRNLYCNENKSIIEIGEILNISPGLIANRLEKLCLIERKQLSRGYFEYIESDLYKKYIEDRRIKREENKKKNMNKVEYKFEQNEINETTKVNLLDIKKIIREKYLTRK